ncbi:MAG TPA: hypothetical protein GX513_00085 [Firmicutes bacterium]|nr:hypothetical protein [Bacillota bacterium]
MSTLESTARTFGFRPVADRGIVRLFHRDIGPYVLPQPYHDIAIGRAAPNWAMMFPSLEVGRWQRLDDYSFQKLARYHTIVLSGFSWHSKAQAEALVAELAAAGKKVIIDLTGVEKEVLSKRARFLGVYAEPMSVRGGLDLKGPWGSTYLTGLGSENEVWETFNLQGLDGETAFTHYLGEKATVAGFKNVGKAKVWFVGANIPFHTYLSGDPGGLAFLSSFTGLSTTAFPDRDPLPVQSYQTGARGASIALEVPADRYPSGGSFIVPVAALDAFTITVDGRPVAVGCTHNLITVDLPAGRHEVQARVTHVPGQTPGSVASAFALLVLVGMTVVWHPYRGISPARGSRGQALPRGE